MPAKRTPKLSPFLAEDFYELNYALDPRIAPDGKAIAYVVQKVSLDRKGYQSALWLCDAAGKSHKRFTAGEKRDHSPRWSPDGTRIAFVSNRSGRNQLWLIGLDGGEAEQLTYLPNGATQPEWSPDGKRLLFVSTVNEAERAAQDKEGISNQPLAPDEQEKLER
ncbi:MAG TPA: DPP IV N-terminal domain-containing protein, partial [Candidatus Bipolaricaulota bacterium]